ncbi:LOW QUALITY PROTEIN: non-specific lipid-transfer protein 2-like [Argentina anserina]|uniref:LOW QUALITY PROTEIN: non-specific lipid-transfer protein 2-like n=1 Tax=Argentina anserina TaxID=57926 RepID=UPI0021766595|nr:LOW QUALITY PROTEIN: non-specific lipid-transfer protein 2-like [Potentilla anserina]
MKLSTISGVSVPVLVFIIFISSAATRDLVVVAAGRIPAAAKADASSCSPMELSPCLDPIQFGSKPSSICCQKLKEQVPCLCGYSYIKNPAFKPYVTGPNAQKLSSNCGVPFPRC